jgi:hypothetical protein
VRGVEGRLFLWVAGSISVYLKETEGGLYTVVMGEFYIVNCKWLPWGRYIVRKWGSGGGVFILWQYTPSY